MSPEDLEAGRATREVAAGPLRDVAAGLSGRQVLTLALLGYAALAVLLTWPLAAHLTTGLLSEASGDTAVYVWNLWVFRHELLEHAHLPFSTGHVLAYTGGTDLSLHNYAPIAGLLALPLIPSLGVIGAYNLLMLAFGALSAIGAFVLARRLGASPAAAWAAGALFAASPVLTARQTGHFSLLIAAPLPLFLWALWQALDTARVRDAVLVGALVAAATYSDAYYGIYCALMGAFVVAWRFGRLEWRGPLPARRRTARALDVIIVAAGALIAWRVTSGTTVLVAGPLRIGLQTLYTPVLLLSVFVAIRAWLAWRPAWRFHDPAAHFPVQLRLGAAAVVTCLVLLLPQLAGIARAFLSDGLPGTEIFWRSSPRGVDALAYLVPNPNHAWFGNATRQWLRPPGEPNWYPEFIASFPLVALGVIAAGARLRALPSLWLGFTGFFVWLSLGPFLYFGGVNTYVPGPWTLLRYVPVVEMARSPSRFAVVAALGCSLLFAFALDALRHRFARARWRSAAAAALALALAFELDSVPRRIYPAAVPDVYARVTAKGDDESGRLLDLPVGIHDGTSPIGRFDAASLYFQTEHERPMIGAYLSRVSPRVKEEHLRSPMFEALFALSEGRDIPEALAREAVASRDEFLRRACIRFVVVDKRQASAALRAFAVDALRLAPVSEDATHVLLAPTQPPPCP
jgi:hypothetical protein